jgi:hypothetical protein
MVISTQVIIDSITYDVHCFTGQVVGTERRDELNIRGEGSGYVSIYKGTGLGFSSSYITSKTTRYKRIFLQTPFGKEEHFDFIDWDIPCRDGHILSVLWIQKRNKPGPIFYVINHSLRQQMRNNVLQLSPYFDEPGIRGGSLDLLFVFLILLMLIFIANTICCSFPVIIYIWCSIKSSRKKDTLITRAKKFVSSDQISQLIQQLEATF